MDSFATYTAEEIDTQTDWGAKMVSRQFRALAARVQHEVLLEELSDITSGLKRRRAQGEEEAAMASCLRNGWSTEALLDANREVFRGQALGYALHWALAQAYYSVHAVARACLSARGATESTHATVIKRVGADMKARRYPTTISFLATGGKSEISFVNLRPHRAPSTLDLDTDNPRSVDTQIAQFLRATRRKDLERKKLNMNIRTVTGKRKRSFTRDDWKQTSAKLGYTSLLSLLYRNRVRANYGEIDTFLSPELETHAVFRSLVSVVGCFNLVHEAMLRAVVGSDTFDRLLDSAGADSHDFVNRRARELRAL